MQASVPKNHKGDKMKSNTMLHRLALLALFLCVVPLLIACGGSDGTSVPQATQAPAPTARPTATPQPTTPPEPTAAQPSSLTNYTHPSGLFSLSYPNGWAVSEDESGVTFTDPTVSLIIVVDVQDLGRVLDSAEMVDYINEALDAGLAASYDNFERSDPQVQPDGSILIEYTFNLTEDTLSYGGSFFEQRGTFFYTLAFIALDDAQWDGAIDTFNAVAYTFLPQASSTGGGDWLTLESAAGGYAIDYPADWEAFELGGDAFIAKDDETFLLIQITTTLPAADPDEAERIGIEELIEALRSDDPGAQVDTPSTIPMGGDEGLYVDFVYTDPDTGLQNSGTIITVVHNGVGYRFLLFTLTEAFEENAGLFVDMLISFRFTN